MALLLTAAQTAGAVHGLPATGRQSQFASHETQSPVSSLITHRHAPPAYNDSLHYRFLIDVSAIRNPRNSYKTNDAAQF
jgi:hypothetical protein